MYAELSSKEYGYLMTLYRLRYGQMMTGEIAH
jgi:hypothetical protein